MRILLTNDDGIDAPGLAALARRLHEDGHDLLVAAPAGDVSGSGTSLGIVADGAVIPAREAGIPSLPDVAAYAVEAPPAFIAPVPPGRSARKSSTSGSVIPPTA